ncbi:septum formation initiator family protein [Paenibacillus ginsengarvi]|uniref:Septum formation initiator family protein n=2 Tax=Paenibacillus ginsengarvi TaxID=400777 RepID=A0A3B0AZQ3_9BACL|nr:septum formation initiator family protein [Paenibacillus ginsengarvi]
MVGFMTWAALILWNQQGRLGVKAAQVDELTQKHVETVKLNEGYKKEIERLNDPEYILQKIRKEYHYSKPGETLFYTPKSP